MRRRVREPGTGANSRPTTMPTTRPVNRPIVSMADLSKWEIDTDDLSEVDVINVQPAQAVTITFDALPGVKLNGRVQAITPKSQTKRGDVTYTVKIAIDNPDPRLKWGMTGQVEIVVR